MKLITKEIEDRVRNNIITSLVHEKYELAMDQVNRVLDELYANIPSNKRSSYGIVYTIKVLSKNLYSQLVEHKLPVYELAVLMLDASGDHKGKGVSLGILSLYGLADYQEVLPHFESAASSSDWNVREYAQMFFRKLIRQHPEKMHAYLLEVVKFADANIRRFVSETLRPVRENRWFLENPTYSLSILKFLFKESAPYPRTSVGNNLSDLSKHLPDLIYKLVEELVASGDKNSYWIAYRACRNLVKQDPLKVMNLLGVDEYRYKNRFYRRSDFSTS